MPFSTHAFSTSFFPLMWLCGPVRALPEPQRCLWLLSQDQEGRGPSQGVGKWRFACCGPGTAITIRNPLPATHTCDLGPVRPHWLLVLVAFACTPGSVPTRRRCPVAWVSMLVKSEV